MYLTFLGLYVAVIISTTTMTICAATALCPEKCQCSGSYPGATTLTVDCHGRQDVDRLTEQLDSLLSGNLTCSRLNVINSPLTHVPQSVCRLTTLTRLNLDDNRLTRLPNNCLTNLTALQELTASRNDITQLQDGLFDGLQQLVVLRLDENRISSIGLNVFGSSANLTSLMHVDLTRNRLTTLEPWPYFVGINGNRQQRAEVSLEGNQVGEFTNKMGLQLTCGIGAVMRVQVNLRTNNIRHISDLLNGWNINLTTMWCLNPFEQTGSTSELIFSYNYLDCDCADFDIDKIVTMFNKITLLDDVYCNRPYYLYHRRVNSIPLIELICELTERCPPGCRCVHRPANSTLHVYCSNSNLTVLPLELPALPKSYTKYKLDLSNNRLLRRLEHRDYFANTSILDVSTCRLETVGNWKQLFGNVKNVYLNGNRLTFLPRSVVSLKLSTEQLSLHDNPWRCGCDDRWMSTWLNSIEPVLLNPVLCAYPQRLSNRNLLHISGDEFCIDPVTKALTIGMSSFTGAVIILIVIGVVAYRLRVRVYTRWKFHPFDRDECLGEDMLYDVFLACSSDDNLPHGNAIRERLEEDCGYGVCYPPRDFLGGETIYDNIYQAVVHSKRTVCFLTSNFIQSSYCMKEFDVALHHNIMVKRKKRLIVLMALDNPNDLNENNDDTAALRQYLSQYTYIDYTANDWLDNLLYALPVRGLLQRHQTDRDDVQLLSDV